MSTQNLFDNTMKVYLNANGSVLETVDTSFFVANSSEVNMLQIYVPRTMNINKANVSFKRADGNIISNRVMLYKGIDTENSDLAIYEYTFIQDDRVLSIGGTLEISFKIEYFNENNTKIYATPIVSSYVRKNIDEKPDISTAEAVYEEIDNLTEELQASVNTANATINLMQIDIADLKGDVEGLNRTDTDIYSKIETLQETDQALSEKIIDEKQNLKEELQAEMNVKFSQLDNKKLNKIFDDVAIANNLADNDYFVLNSGNVLYRITFQSMRNIILENVSEGGANHYKGDFLTYEALVEEFPVGQPGDYAFVNVGSEMIMYVWDNNGADESYQGIWRETTSGQYVLSTTFANLQEQLLNGRFIVDTAKNYQNEDGTKTNIKEKMDIVDSKIDSLENNAIIIIDLGLITDLTNQIKITQSQWDTIASYKNVKIKATMPINSEDVIEAIFDKYNTYYRENTPYSFWFRSNAINTIFYFAQIQSDLTVFLNVSTYAKPETLSLSLSDETKLINSISDGDTTSYSEIDLTPAIQKVIDDNDVYVVEYDNLQKDAKVLELIRANKFQKIIINKNNRYCYFSVFLVDYFGTTRLKYGVPDYYILETKGYTTYNYVISITVTNPNSITDWQNVNIVGTDYLNYYNVFSTNSFNFIKQLNSGQYRVELQYATSDDVSTGTDIYKTVNPKVLKEYTDDLIEPINTSIDGLNLDLETQANKILALENAISPKEELVISNENWSSYITIDENTELSKVTFVINNIANKSVLIDINKNVWSTFWEYAIQKNYNVSFSFGTNCKNSDITILNTDVTFWDQSYCFAGTLEFIFGKRMQDDTSLEIPRYIINYLDFEKTLVNEAIVLNSSENIYTKEAAELLNGDTIYVTSMFSFINLAINNDSSLGYEGFDFNRYIYYFEIKEDNKKVLVFISKNNYQIQKSYTITLNTTQYEVLDGSTIGYSTDGGTTYTNITATGTITLMEKTQIRFKFTTSNYRPGAGSYCSVGTTSGGNELINADSNSDTFTDTESDNITLSANANYYVAIFTN